MNTLLLLIVIVVFVVAMIIVLIRIPNKGIVVEDDPRYKRIEDIRRLAYHELDPLKRQIILGYCSYLMNSFANTFLKPLIDDCRSKNGKPSILQNYQNYYNRMTAEAELLHYNVTDGVSDEELASFREFANAFGIASGSEMVWEVLSSVRDFSYKSSAHTAINRRSVSLKFGDFYLINSSLLIPILPSSLGNLYFYPRFVIQGNTAESFRVIPLQEVKMSFAEREFIEDEHAPTDAKKVGGTYKFVTRSGRADLRFADNPYSPVFSYGEITVSPFAEYLFSNVDSAKRLATCFYGANSTLNTIKTIHLQGFYTPPEVNKPTIILDEKQLYEAAKMVVKARRVSLTDFQNKLGVTYQQSHEILGELVRLGIVDDAKILKNVRVKTLEELDAFFDTLK